MKKVLALISAILILFTVSCSDNYDFEDKIVVFKGDFVSKPYITALANENYYMDFSLVYDGQVISNTLATDGNVIESRSEVDGSFSHTIFIDGATYFIDDENKVYFKADVSSEDGLRGIIDYSKCKYIGSGKADILIGNGYNYDEFSCKTIYGENCTVRIFTDEKGEFAAIVDSMGEDSVERDIAYFSSDIPDGWLSVPEYYTLVDEETFFEMYYGDER